MLILFGRPCGDDLCHRTVSIHDQNPSAGPNVIQVSTEMVSELSNPDDLHDAIMAFFD
jgi:hypothetical protein